MNDDTDDGIVIASSHVNGQYWPAVHTGRELIARLYGEDHGAPIISVTIRAKTDDGKVVEITIPNRDITTVQATIIDPAG